MKKNILLRGIMVGALAVATAGFAGCHANIGPPSLDWEVQQMGGHGEEGHEAEGHEAEGHEEELLEEILHEELLEEEILDIEDVEETDVLDEEDIEVVAHGDSGTAVTIDHVNFRTKASRDADIMESLTTGVEVEVLSSDGEWAHISYDGKTGYVSVDYLEFTEE